MATMLGVGMIGVSADGGWALEGHVPAVHAVEGLELVAVGSRTQENADRAAVAAGARTAHGDPRRLIRDPFVDVVAVVSPVPTHRRWILEALDAGKHVLTEWPVAPSTAEVDEIAATAESTGVATAVDLQARMSLAAHRAASLVQEGRIGRVLGTTVLSSTAAFGPEIPAGAIALERTETGMHLRTIQTAHSIDFASRVVGPIADLQAVGAVQFPEVRVSGSGDVVRRELPDRILLQGTFGDGSTLSMQVVGGRPPEDSPFRMEVQGTTGTLRLSGGGPRGFQASAITLSVDDRVEALESGETADLDASARNVARVYAALRDDIRTGSRTAPGLAHAARLADLVERLTDAFATGDRLHLPR